jgi:WD40 repeat protein
MIISARWDGELRLWTLTDDGAVLRAGAVAKGSVLSAAVSPDGKTLAVGGVGTIALWRVEAGRLAPVTEWATSPYLVTALAFSPDGRVLAAGSNSNTAVRFWRLGEDNEPTDIDCGTRYHARGLGFSPDGRVLNVLDTDGGVARLNLDDGQRMNYQLPVPPCRQGAFSADGRRVLIAHHCGAARWESVRAGDRPR